MQALPVMQWTPNWPSAQGVVNCGVEPPFLVTTWRVEVSIEYWWVNVEY